MRSLKSVFGVIGTLVAISYCGGLVYYFLNLSGSMQEAQNIGLGPTVIGLGAFGALFCVILLMRLVLIVLKARKPGAGGDPTPSKGGFDAEAAFNRYMAQRSVDKDPAGPAAPSSPKSTATPQRPQGFGRKNR